MESEARKSSVFSLYLAVFAAAVFSVVTVVFMKSLLGLARWLVFNIPMLFFMNYVVGMYGIVWSQVTADTLTVILSFYVYHRYRPRNPDREKRTEPGKEA